LRNLHQQAAGSDASYRIG